MAKDFHPQYNRHWYRHVLVAFSPGGIIPLPFPIWLGFPDGLVVNCYHLGMVRYFLLESCRPDDKYLLSVRDDFERKLTEEGTSTWRKSCSDIGWNLSYDMSGGMRKPVVTSLYLWNNY